MPDVHRKVADVLNHTHSLQSARINQHINEMGILQVGDLVWYKRPENSGEKIDSRWIGPGIVKAREGERSYLIEVKPGVDMTAHRSFLKPYK